MSQAPPARPPDALLARPPADAGANERMLPEPAAARLRLEGSSGERDAACDDPASVTLAAGAGADDCEVESRLAGSRDAGEWLREHAAVLLPVAGAAVLAVFAVSRADAGLELAALLLVAAALAAGHLLMRARREREGAARETVRLRQELELRARVAECEARRARLTAFSELAAQIAHEVRNPLASIVLNTELLEEELGACAAAGGLEVRALVSSIKAEAARLHTLTDEYLTFARLPRADPAPAAINALVEETARFTREEIARQGIDLRLRLASHLPDALIDRKGVRQVVLNLLRNAIEATPSGGCIDIVTGMADGAVRVEVRDTGRGIPPEVRDSVFDPFFSTKSKGTGLGLAVARRIVTDHGGALLVADSDRGARLVFTLPLAGAASAARDGAAAAPALAGAGS